jgi:hypothetical protein
MGGIRYSNWLATIGALGGVFLATALPWMIIAHATDFSVRAKIFLIVLAVVGGVILAAISTVVGITIPTALVDAKMDLSRFDCSSDPDCCPTVENDGAGESSG